MRKTNVFIAVTTAALAAAGMSVPATESKAKTDAYLIVDLAKVSEPVEGNSYRGRKSSRNRGK